MRNRHVPRSLPYTQPPWEIATTHDDHETHHPLDGHSAQDAEERVLVGAGRS